MIAVWACVRSRRRTFGIEQSRTRDCECSWFPWPPAVGHPPPAVGQTLALRSQEVHGFPGPQKRRTRGTQARERWFPCTRRGPGKELESERKNGPVVGIG